MNRQEKLAIIKEIFLMLWRVCTLPVVLPIVVLTYSIFSIVFFTSSYVVNGNIKRAWKRVGREVRADGGKGVFHTINVEHLKDCWSVYDLREAYYMKRRETLENPL